jgi:hypothetical protein
MEGRTSVDSNKFYEADDSTIHKGIVVIDTVEHASSVIQSLRSKSLSKQRYHRSAENDEYVIQSVLEFDRLALDKFEDLKNRVDTIQPNTTQPLQFTLEANIDSSDEEPEVNRSRMSDDSMLSNPKLKSQIKNDDNRSVDSFDDISDDEDDYNEEKQSRFFDGFVIKSNPSVSKRRNPWDKKSKFHFHKSSSSSIKNQKNSQITVNNFFPNTSINSDDDALDRNDPRLYSDDNCYDSPPDFSESDIENSCDELNEQDIDYSHDNFSYDNVTKRNSNTLKSRPHHSVDWSNENSKKPTYNQGANQKPQSFDAYNDDDDDDDDNDDFDGGFGHQINTNDMEAMDSLDEEDMLYDADSGDHDHLLLSDSSYRKDTQSCSYQGSVSSLGHDESISSYKSNIIPHQQIAADSSTKRQSLSAISKLSNIQEQSNPKSAPEYSKHIQPKSIASNRNPTKDSSQPFG